tara:strand:- start:904 stop:1629 length:726 start_codon:yes stop_codon:yes gene_type:complete
MDIRSLFGLDLDSQAQAEIADLNDTNTGFRKRDPGDFLRSFVSGIDEEALRKRTQELQTKEINRTIGKGQGILKDQAAGTGLTVDGLAYKPGSTVEEYQTNLGIQESRIKDVQTLRSMKGGENVELDPNAGSGAIRQAQGTLRDTNEDKAETKVKTEVLRQEERSDDRYFNERQDRHADRKFDRRRDDARNDLTMQLAQMDSALADKRLAYDRETRSMDKRDKMIATLMSGIGQLGGAFAL